MTISKKTVAAAPAIVQPVAVVATPTPANTNVAQPVAAPAIVHTPQPATSTSPSWMLKGADKKAAYDAEQAKSEAAKAGFGRAFRYSLGVNMKGRFTFLDGVLDEEGLLANPSLHEHTIKMNNRYHNFACIGMDEPCPACEAGQKPALISLFTVIDHMPYTVPAGKPKAGQVYVNQRKLFVAKKKTTAQLQFKATALGGLMGCTMASARLDTGDGKSPGVGTDFEMVERLTLDQINAKYGVPGQPALVPLNYETEIQSLTAAQMVALGFGKSLSGPGYSQGSTFDAAKMGSQM